MPILATVVATSRNICRDFFSSDSLWKSSWHSSCCLQLIVFTILNFNHSPNGYQCLYNFKRTRSGLWLDKQYQTIDPDTAAGMFPQNHSFLWILLTDIPAYSNSFLQAKLPLLQILQRQACLHNYWNFPTSHAHTSTCYSVFLLS